MPTTTRRKTTRNASQAQRRALVVGAVTSKKKGAQAALLVRALSVDLRQSTLLGQALTDGRGYYQIAYDADKPLNIQVEVLLFTGQLLATSAVRFSAGRREKIDVAVDAPLLSEYDKVAGAVRLATTDLAGQALSPDDVPFLHDRIAKLPFPLPFRGEITEDRLRLWIAGEELGAASGLPGAFFYGVARTANLKPPLAAETFAQLPTDRLRGLLENAIKSRIVPPLDFAPIAPLLDGLRLSTQVLAKRRLAARLVDEASGTPLLKLKVRTTHQNRDVVLGTTPTDDDGVFIVDYLSDGTEVDRLQFDILDILDNPVQTMAIAVRERVGLLSLPVSLPAGAAPSPDIGELSAAVGIELPSGVSAALEEQGITTLADLREAGGFRAVPQLPVPPNHPALARIEAHANLSLLSGYDPPAANAVIAAGFDSVTAIAETDRPTFVTSVQDAINPYPAASLLTQARASEALIRNMLANLRADRFPAPGAAGDDGDLQSSVRRELEQALPDGCRCNACETAAGFAAYLADLLEYVVGYVKDNGVALTVEDLEATFFQPFRDLPLSCEQVHTTLAQSRVCVEVLHRYLAAKALPELGSPQAADLIRNYVAYVEAAYGALLRRLGVSLEELRAALLAPSPAPAAGLLRRLRLPPDVSLQDFVLDVTPASVAEIERELEHRFGLVDTQKDVFSHGAKLGDADEQISRWTFDGVVWNKNTDADGYVHLSLSAPTAGSVRVELFRDEARTQLVASGDAPLANADVLVVPPDPGPQAASSGLRGMVRVAFQNPDTATRISLIPLLVSRQLRALEAQWRILDEGAPPLLDPDLITLAELRTPVDENPAFSIWTARTTALSNRLAALGAIGTTSSDADRFDALLADAQVELAGAELLDAERSYLQSIQAAISAATPLPVLDSEWRDVISILVQVEKRRQRATWTAEEQAADLRLTPESFQAPDDLTARLRELPAFRADPGAYRRLLQKLISRVEDRDRLLAAHRTLLEGVEEDTLATLRDALILASDAAGAELTDKADFITRNLLINARMVGRQSTTRVAQAVETLQTFVWSVRIGLFNDRRPGLDVYTSNFDEEWKWIGSYEAWRAAMMVFLYPENVLDPTLRRPQTPAFSTLVTRVRDNTQLTPADAKHEAKSYAAYVNDVGAIRIEATCQARAPLAEPGSPDQGVTGTALFSFLFGRSESTGNVYISTHRPGVATGYDQSYWRAIPELAGVSALLGAAVYERSAVNRYIYVFARKTGEQGDALLYVRWNLEAQALDPGGPFTLDLPPDVTRFSAVIQQSNDPTQPPALVLLFNDRVFINRLTREGNALDPAVQALGGFFFHFGNGPALTTLAMVALDVFPGRNYLLPQFFLLFGTNGTQIFYKLFAPANEGELLTTYRTTAVTLLANGTWKGTALWPDAPNLAYTFWTQNGVLKHNAIFFDDNVAQAVPADPNGSLGALPSLAGLDRVAINSGAHLSSGLNKTIAYQLTGVNKGPYLGFFSRDPSGTAGGLLGGLAGELSTTATVSVMARVAFRMNTGLGTRVNDDGTVIDPGGGFPPPPPPPPPTPPDRLPIVEMQRLRLAPLLRQPVQIAQGLTETQLQVRRGTIAAAFQDNTGATRTNLSYLEEAFFFVPVLIAQQVQRRGHFLDALDWYRTVYDYTQPHDLRKIYFGLVSEESLPWTYDRNIAWLLEPLNPHAIAATRRNTYTRFTLRSLAECFASFGDSEFGRDTAESIARAQVLYATALDLLDLDELSPEQTPCESTLADLDQTIADNLGGQPGPVRGAWTDVVGALSALDPRTTFTPTAAAVRGLIAGEGSVLDRLSEASRLVHAAAYGQRRAATVGEIQTESEERTARARTILLKRPEVARALGEISSVAELDLDHTVTSLTGVDKATLEGLPLPWLAAKDKRIQLPPAVGLAKESGASHVDVLSRVAQSQPLAVFSANQRLGSTFLITPQDHFCVPPNPAISSLRAQVQLNLEKIRSGRNIGGLERTLQPYGLDDGAVPSVDRRGDVIAPERLPAPPTVFRFRTLIERAKQLVGLAQQLEATFLSILEKRDAEYYNLLKARQDLTLSLASIRLQQLGLIEAQDNVRLSQLQFDRAQLQADHYQGLLDETEGTAEKLALVAQGVTAAVSIGVGIATSSGSSLVSGLSALGGLLTGGDREKRKQELQQALALAKQDVQIGGQSIRIANDRVNIRAQELNIGNLQSSHAQETLEFLVNKFTNAELYDWMSGVMEGVYRSFLQQATAVAQSAANQLAFERQEAIPRFIQADYWEALVCQQGFVGDDEERKDRRGLTGSARLLQDIFQLDQFAFDTERRKQQLTKTISLGRAAAAEFQRFRETGVLHFVTLLSTFDADFPGHFLRLIKRVRVSVIALIPPTEGIKASLSTGGISKVVTRDGASFRESVILRQPETVSLSSPLNASGEFELTIQPDNDLLHPFEGSGVAADWTFELPKPANQFAFDAIADVLVTFDYTALDSADYRKEVVERLGRDLSADRALTFRFELPDQWFDLSNPDQTPTPLAVRFSTRRQDFLPNLDGLELRQVALFFSRADGETFEMDVSSLLFTPDGETTSVGGPAVSDDGIISTRRGNADPWLPMLGKSPVGDWQLSFPDNEENRRRFQEERVRDILLVVTYAGQTPDWPR